MFYTNQRHIISNHYSPEQWLRVIYLKKLKQKHSSAPGFEDHIKKGM